MGPGRLTGMNGPTAAKGPHRASAASMGPGRLTGMNAGDGRAEQGACVGASMGPGRLTGMNAASRAALIFSISPELQWGPVD